MHTPVLTKETMELLSPKEGETIFEGTGGEGGLSLLIVERLGPKGKLIVTDLDENNLNIVRYKLSQYGDTSVCKVANFRDIKRTLGDLEIKGVDGILLDLGLASSQIEESGRGFTFNKNEPLIMTFSSSPDELTVTARDVVNNWKEESLAEIFRGFGWERKADKIARLIMQARKSKIIETTGELIEIVKQVYPNKPGRLHPATRVFQALRMAVNDEVGAIRQILRDGWSLLNPEARFVVLSFHEIEDREIKTFFKNMAGKKLGNLVTKKPVLPNRAEVRINPRSRRAKLRAIVKI